MRMLCSVLLGGIVAMSAAQETPVAIRWGVDDAGTEGALCNHPQGGEIAEELGLNFLVTHHHFGTPDLEQNKASIRRIDAWCAQRGITWVANLESPNFVKQHIDEQGRDWYNRPDGRHFFLFPEELLDEFGQCQALWGFMYDEAAHMQNCRNKIAGLDQPWIFDPEGHTLETAADAFTEAVREVGELHGRYGIPLSTEHVFPVLYHGFARAGWTAGTKILKENWSPAYIACALGAALQYDTELWITPDLWGLSGYPGHSVEEYRSALLLAYHMGADCIYTENLAYDNERKGIGSLVLLSKDGYTLTDYGQVTKWFRWEYMPAHPRPYTFRDVRPRVAIVRQPDACWGQSDSWLPNTLFGCKDWPSNETTEAWLRLWHLLSNGTIPEYSLSWHNTKLRDRPYQVFCPLDGVVVFDHRVRRAHLQGVEVIFLTGLGVSEETLADIESCVRAGATCVSLPHLLPARLREDLGETGTVQEGKGRWVATKDFLAPHVREHVQHILPEGDVLRYRFGKHTVTFRPVDGDPNRLTVEP